jgi:hypothetical protein
MTNHDIFEHLSFGLKMSTWVHTITFEKKVPEYLE